MENKIKVLLVGYGKMGKMIHENAELVNADIVSIIDPNNTKYDVSFDSIDFTNIDVAIEFTHPEVCLQNIEKLINKNIPVVTGTTGWFGQIEGLYKKINPEAHTLIYGANYSIGMNLFYEIVNSAAGLINQTGLYDFYGLESHHRQKADSPSGTAKVLSEILLENSKNKDKAIYDINNKQLGQNEFTFTSVRAGNITGYHEIGFDSDFDEIKLIHNAKSRKGFALGALFAARYALKIKGIFNFKDIFHDVIKI